MLTENDSVGIKKTESEANLQCPWIIGPCLNARSIALSANNRDVCLPVVQCPIHQRRRGSRIRYFDSLRAARDAARYDRGSASQTRRHFEESPLGQPGFEVTVVGIQNVHTLAEQQSRNNDRTQQNCTKYT